MEKEINEIKETYINKSENCIIGEYTLPIYDSKVKNLKELYQYGLKNLGKCVSKIFIDTKTKSKHIGYVFEKKAFYTDTKETYIQEVWVSLEHYIEKTVREYLPIK